ncbi:MAG: hypothetical protein LBJ11_06250 [Oscillospiraceae bacterium]|jgi:hypothetical protein|nr:hypothetical protein [Oscillospiraceae bacterium]
MRKVPQDKAVVTVYGGKKITVNGKPWKEFPHKGGGFLSGFTPELTLEPGEYTVSGEFITTTNMSRTNVTAKNITLTANLQAGQRYDIGLFEGSYDLEVAAASVQLDRKDWYVILRHLEG